MVCAAITTGSMPSCGRAACEPLPVISMSNLSHAASIGPAHSANSQFYVNLADNSELDPLPTRWGYTVFGQVIEGMDVIERIGVIATGSVGPFKSEAPLKPIVIQKMEPLTSSAAGAAPPAPPAPPPPSPSGEGATPPPQ